MKVIDLLNKIANGEEVPKKFIFDDREFYLRSKDCYSCDDAIFEETFILEDLNKEIKMIEEKKIPKKLKCKYTSQISKIELAKTINEIIDYLEENK